MNEREACELLEAEVAKLRANGYDDLVRLMDNQQDYFLTGPSGTKYGVELDVVWDQGTRGDGTIRVIAMIDDGGPSAMRPMVSAFILAPNGTFVGE
jgi:hypothetical protein